MKGVRNEEVAVMRRMSPRSAAGGDGLLEIIRGV
jgi:hypothetical protein